MPFPRFMFLFIGTAATSLATSTLSIYVYPNQTKNSLGIANHEGLVFHSIFEARNAIRRLRAHQKSKVYVELRGGTHYLDKTFKLDSRDARKGPSTSVIYRSYNNERATLSGGVRIRPDSFRPFDLNIVKVNLFEPPYNLRRENFGSLSNPYPSNMSELFYNGEPMTLARDPNVADNGTWIWAGYEHMSPINNISFSFSDEQTGAWWKGALEDPRVASPDMWLHGYFKYDWKDTYVKLDRIEMLSTNETNRDINFNVTVSSNTKPQYPWIKGCRFYALNALMLLDTPGEYFLNRDSGDLFFYPPKRLSRNDELIISFLGNIIAASGADHTSFVDLSFEYSRSTAMLFHRARNLSIRNVTISNSGGGCVDINGINSIIANSTLHGCGDYGIQISGGDIDSLAPSQLRVVNNVIYNFSRITRTYQGAVLFNGVGIYVANNTIMEGPHTGISGSGVNNLFEYNFISRVSYECTDTGAFYTGRSWAQRGNVARFNTFDNVRSIERLAQKNMRQVAFYLDDQMSGWDFYGNLIQNCNTGVLLGGGRRNKIHDNYFRNNDLDIHFDNRGMTYQKLWCQKDCDPSTGSRCFYTALREVNYSSPPYSIAFPEIVDVYDYHPCVPVGNIIEDNKYCHDSCNGSENFFRLRKYVNQEKFIDIDSSTILHWYSSLSNNYEHCESSVAVG